MQLPVLLLALHLAIAQPLGVASMPITGQISRQSEYALGEYIAQKAQEDYQDQVAAIINNTMDKYPYWKNNGFFGFYINELETGLEGGYNHQKLDDEGLGFFQTASTVKLLMGCVVAYLDHQGLIDWQEEIYDPVSKRSYIIKDITKVMISHSVNDYFNVLLRYVGVEKTNEVLHTLGAANSRVFCELLPSAYANNQTNQQKYGAAKAPRTTPKDLGMCLELIYQETFGPENSDFLMESLLACIYDSRIPGSIGKEVPVAHKTGSHSYSINDAGIVFLDNNPYVIVVMGYFINKKADPVLRAVSTALYNYEKERIEEIYQNKTPLWAKALSSSQAHIEDKKPE